MSVPEGGTVHVQMLVVRYKTASIQSLPDINVARRQLPKFLTAIRAEITASL